MRIALGRSIAFSCAFMYLSIAVCVSSMAAPTKGAVKNKVRVAIVGGGNAGAAAAYFLSEAQSPSVEFEITVLEGSSRLSGRSYSKLVKLSDGSTVTINTGTQMNFEKFMDILPAPVSLKLKNSFIETAQNISVVSGSKDGKIRVHTLPRIGDSNNFDEVEKKAKEVDALGIVPTSDLGLGAIASARLREDFLKKVSFNDLIDYLKSNKIENIDKISAYDFLVGLAYPLRPTVTVTNPFSWISAPAKVWKFSSGSDQEKMALGQEALVNLLYAQGYREAKYSETFVKRLIESMEKIVEFSDLKSMSALNFLWQLKWVVEGGSIISPNKGWDRVAEAFLSFLPEKQILLDHRVLSISDNPDGSHSLVVQRSNGTADLNLTADIVINTADTDVALNMYQKPSRALRAMLEANEYSSTIAVHIETDMPVAQLLGTKTPALSAETGLFKKIGGLTFQTGLTGEPRSGKKEIVGAFLQSEVASSLIAVAKQKGWSESRLQAETLKIVVQDLRTIDNTQMSRIADSIENGHVVSLVSWEKALPFFRPGYFELVAKYRQELSEKPESNLYGGQAVDGRSIAMVIPGMKRLTSTITGWLEKNPKYFSVAPKARVQNNLRLCIKLYSGK